MRYASYYRWLVATRVVGLPTTYPDAILDIGTEKGDWLKLVSAPLKVGVDLEHSYIPDIYFIQADAIQLPFKDHVYSNIWVFDVMEHIADDQTFIIEVLRVLSPDGRIWLSTTSKGFRLFPGGRIQRAFESKWGHVRRGYDINELIQLIPDQCEVRITPWNEPAFRFLYLLLYLSNKISSKITNRMIEWIFRIDNCFQAGAAGHYFLEISIEQMNRS